MQGVDVVIATIKRQLLVLLIKSSAGPAAGDAAFIKRIAKSSNPIYTYLARKITGRETNSLY